MILMLIYTSFSYLNFRIFFFTLLKEQFSGQNCFLVFGKSHILISVGTSVILIEILHSFPQFFHASHGRSLSQPCNS